MGLLFKRKPLFDPEECIANKKKMREIFNEAVVEGESYRILHGGYTQSKTESGIYIDTTVTTYFNYIIGYRESDFSIVAVETDKELTQYGDPLYIVIQDIKKVEYTKKYNLICLVYKEHIMKTNGIYMFAFQFGDTDAKTRYVLRNVQQQEEREQFVEFIKRYKERLA